VRGAGDVGCDACCRGVPYALGLALVAALAPARCVDCSELLAGARLVKSQLELDCLRRAGGYAEAGLRPALAHARPGISERELAAEIEYAMRRAGSDYPSIPTELASGPRSVLVHGTPGHRLLEPGDLVHVEIGGVEARYTAVGLQTFHVGGAPPPPVGVHLYGVAQACLRTGLDAIRPGIEAPAIEAPALAILRDAGPRARDDVRPPRLPARRAGAGRGRRRGDVRGRRGRCRDTRRRGPGGACDHLTFGYSGQPGSAPRLSVRCLLGAARK
jgi:Xaa-Pro dipeptidase